MQALPQTLSHFSAHLQMRDTPTRELAQAASGLVEMRPGDGEIKLSSRNVGWKNVLVEAHVLLPGQWRTTCSNWHMISEVKSSMVRVEYQSAENVWRSHLEVLGTIACIPPGTMPQFRLHNRMEVLYCALSDSFISAVAGELETAPPSGPVFRRGIHDSSVKQICALLMQEAENESSSGRLYIESLAYALATRYLKLSSGVLEPSTSNDTKLPPTALKRVLAKIDAHLDRDISLESLADETGYSRAHFVRLFRATTGTTPHQYVLTTRLKRAMELLRRGGLDLIDIAAECGFSSQSHMTNVFRNRLGTSPGEYRRDQLSRSGNRETARCSYDTGRPGPASYSGELTYAD